MFPFKSNARECSLFRQGQRIKVISDLSSQIPPSKLNFNDHLVVSLWNALLLIL